MRSRISVQLTSDTSFACAQRCQAVCMSNVWSEICSTVGHIHSQKDLAHFIISNLNRYNMMTHFKAHQGIHRVNAKSFSCPICQITVAKRCKLDEHLATHHNTINAAAATISAGAKSIALIKFESGDVVSTTTTSSTMIIPAVNEGHHLYSPGATSSSNLVEIIKEEKFTTVFE